MVILKWFGVSTVRRTGSCSSPSPYRRSVEQDRVEGGGGLFQGSGGVPHRTSDLWRSERSRQGRRRYRVWVLFWVGTSKVSTGVPGPSVASSHRADPLTSPLAPHTTCPWYVGQTSPSDTSGVRWTTGPLRPGVKFYNC